MTLSKIIAHRVIIFDLVFQDLCPRVIDLPGFGLSLPIHDVPCKYDILVLHSDFTSTRYEALMMTRLQLMSTH